jgi:hypothetical protein
VKSGKRNAASKASGGVMIKVSSKPQRSPKLATDLRGSRRTVAILLDDSNNPYNTQSIQRITSNRSCRRPVNAYHECNFLIAVTQRSTEGKLWA